MKCLIAHPRRGCRRMRADFSVSWRVTFALRRAMKATSVAVQRLFSAGQVAVGIVVDDENACVETFSLCRRWRGRCLRCLLP